MKLKKWTACLLSAGILFSLFGCNGKLTLKGATLPHYDGSNTTEGYDASVFYKNELTVFGGDSDVIWVSEEQDPVNGGYFYQYMSGNTMYTPSKWFATSDQGYGISCLRSKDMLDWELCGAVDDGYSVRLYREDWLSINLWAPEVTYDEQTERYYMFLTAKAFGEDTYHTNVDYDTTNFHFAVLSSEFPQGPFTLLSSEDYYGFKGMEYTRNADGEAMNGNGDVITTKKPSIDIGKHFNCTVTTEDGEEKWYPFPVLDVSPFVDDNGDKYLYFCRHYVRGTSGEAYLPYKNDNMSIWVMKMDDWLTPDYDSLRMLIYPNMKSVEYLGGENDEPHDEKNYKLVPYEENERGYGENEGDLVEGAQVTAHTSADGKKRYYLTYSQQGYAARDYGVHQAVSESPFGPFVKLGREKSAMAVTLTNDYMTGVGHHAYVDIGDELYCVYWVHSDPFNVNCTEDNGRAYAFDKTAYVYDPELGYDILYGNGPTASLQPLPTLVNGLTNVAPKANISVSGDVDKSSLKYLTDGVFTVVEYFEENEFKAKGQTKIMLEFDEPQAIRAIMLYNSISYDYAFSQIDGIVFTLAEKPAWYTSNDYNGYVYIKDLKINSEHYSSTGQFMRQGGSALASFDEIKVSKIELLVSQTLDGGKEFRLSELYVLGK